MVSGERLLKRALPRLAAAALAAVFGVNAAAAADPSPQCQKKACVVAILGDSLTASYGLALEDGLPAQLARALDDADIACEVVDAGVSGDTSAGALARIDWTLDDRISHMILAIGGNDGLRALPPEALEANLDAIAAATAEREVELFIAGMLAPPNLGRDYGEAFAAAYPAVAERWGAPLYPFLLDGVAGDPSLNQPDGIHPTAQGIALVVERMGPMVVDWLRETSCPEG